MSIERISRIYLMALLLAAALISPLPCSAIAFILLILQLYSFLRPIRAEPGLALTFGTLILAPLTLESTLGPLLSALLIIPSITLLDCNLRESASKQAPPPSRGGRKVRTTLKALGGSLLLALAFSPVVENKTLALTAAFLGAYMVGISAYVLYRIPKMPLECSRSRIRVIAGDTAEATIAVKGRAKIPLHIWVHSSHPWVHLNPAELMLSGDETRVRLNITPPLAGPSKLELQAIVIDPWGLTLVNQTLDVAELNVIPRARYAEWLARRYLEETMPGAAPTAVALSVMRMPAGFRRGMEYYGSRLYQPGDRLKDIDWKHTLKVRETVIKEYIEAQGNAAIIAVNLATGDAEQADLVAYNLIISVLTLAREGVPVALAAYDHREVMAATAAVNPRETLKKALKLVEHIVRIQPLERFLNPPDIRRAIGQLERAKTEPARRLMEILKVERQVLEQETKVHPAARALMEVTGLTPSPATITVLSALNHDADALPVMLDKLNGRGYSILQIRSRAGETTHFKSRKVPSFR